MSYNAAAKAMAIQTTPAQAAFAHWLVQQLDQPAQPGRQPVSYEFHSPLEHPDENASAVRVVFLTHTKTPQALQEMMQVIRTGAEVQRALPIASEDALVLRAKPERIALAEWLIAQLDQPAQPGRQAASYSASTSAYDPSETAVRVYYLSHTVPADAIPLATSLRTSARLNRVFYCSTPGALAFRGSPDQVAAGEQLIAAADK